MQRTSSWRALGLALGLSSLLGACGGIDLEAGDDDGEEAGETLEVSSQALASAPIGIGVLIDAASPAKANFTAAAELAVDQINRGLRRAGSCVRFQAVISYYGAGLARAAAISLVNDSHVKAVVSDISGNTAAVNALNYETPSAIAYKVPVTCYQCSSAFFNDPTQTNPGFADLDNWLYRTFFNASFESAVQVQLVLNKANGGDFNGDGFVKIAVYYDSFHLSAATTMPGLMDALATGPHGVELVAKTLPSTPASRAAEIASLLDSGPDGHAPDAVYLAFLPQNAAESLADYRATGTTVPAQANNGVRRDFLLPTLLANGGAGLEGSSVRVVADSAAGRRFDRKFRARAAAAPELTASFLYDAVAAPALAVLHRLGQGALDQEGIRASLGLINQPNGSKISAGVSGFAKAADKLGKGKAIDYDGASSPLDLTAVGEMYPDLVHWRIEAGAFVELESYQCDPAHPTCQAQ